MILGKTVLITGAYGGLGRELSIKLAKRGCNLFLVGRDSKKLKDFCKELKSYNYDIEIKSKSINLRSNITISYLKFYFNS